jgi:hypothetical protein
MRGHLTALAAGMDLSSSIHPSRLFTIPGCPSKRSPSHIQISSSASMSFYGRAVLTCSSYRECDIASRLSSNRLQEPNSMMTASSPSNMVLLRLISLWTGPKVWRWMIPLSIPASKRL